MERLAQKAGLTAPNCPDAREYIVNLVERIVTVSVETVVILAALPPLHLDMPSIDQPSDSDEKA